MFPGFDGGGEWGGSAFDPETGIFYINANDVAWTGGLAENKRGKHRAPRLLIQLRHLPRRRAERRPAANSRAHRHRRETQARAGRLFYPPGSVMAVCPRFRISPPRK